MLAASHGLTSNPRIGAPKKARNSCISRGVPWNTCVKAVESRARTTLPEVRESAMARPPIAPPMKATSESRTVHCAACRMNQTWPNPNVRRGSPQRRSGAGGEHEQNDLARQRREDGPQGGFEHHQSEDLVRLQVGCETCLDLALGDGFNARANDLGGIGAQVRHHRNECGSVWRPPQPDCGQGKEKEEKLNQERRVPNELDVRIHDEAHG